MNERQARLYRHRCDIYMMEDGKKPSFLDIPCLLVHGSEHSYGMPYSQLSQNKGTFFFCSDQKIEPSWTIHFKLEGHPENESYWAVRGMPKGRGGKVDHIEVECEKVLIRPNCLV